MAGGQFMFEDLNNLGIEAKVSPVKGAVPPGGANPPAATWQIAPVASCTGSNKQVRATLTITPLTYPAKVVFQVKNAQGAYVTDPDTDLNITLASATDNNGITRVLNIAYSTNPWRVMLQDGTGAQQAVSSDIGPLNCP